MDVWLANPQLHLLAEAIDERYRAMVILSGRTGLRFGECAGLLWTNLELDTEYDDGAVAGVGRLAAPPAAPASQVALCGVAGIVVVGLLRPW